MGGGSVMDEKAVVLSHLQLFALLWLTGDRNPLAKGKCTISINDVILKHEARRQR